MNNLSLVKEGDARSGDDGADVAKYVQNKYDFLYANILIIVCIFSPADASLLQKIIRKGLIDTKSEIDVIREDPNSPLYSAKTFEELKL